MKFFPIALLLPLALDGLKGLTLPQGSPDKGLNTTLVANFSGLYERRNPCNNEKLESSSYAATHEYHHHTKGESWSDYTQRCSTIITNFLKSISSLIRCNHKDDGTFTFHVNTTISQKQADCKDRKCSIPTIIIEATNCVDKTPEPCPTEEDTGEEKGCRGVEEAFGDLQTSTETIPDQITPVTISETTQVAETDDSFTRQNTGQEWEYITEQPRVTSGAFVSQTVDAENQFRGQEIQPSFETVTDLSSVSRSTLTTGARTQEDFTSPITEQPNPVYTRPPQNDNPSFFLTTLPPPTETTDEIDEYDTESLNVGNTPQAFTTGINPTLQPTQPAVDYLENQDEYVSTADQSTTDISFNPSLISGFRPRGFPETTPQPNYDYPLDEASSYSQEDSTEEQNFYQNDEVSTTYPPNRQNFPLDEQSGIPFVGATSQTNKDRNDFKIFTPQVPDSYQITPPSIQPPEPLLRSNQNRQFEAVTQEPFQPTDRSDFSEQTSETVDNEKFSEDSVYNTGAESTQWVEEGTQPPNYFPANRQGESFSEETNRPPVTKPPVTPQGQVSSFAEETSQTRTDFYPPQTPNYGAITPPQDDLFESSDYDISEPLTTTPLPTFSESPDQTTSQEPYTDYDDSTVDQSRENTEDSSVSESQENSTAAPYATSGSSSYQQSTTSAGIYESQTEIAPVEGVKSDSLDRQTSDFTPNPYSDYGNDYKENVDAYSTQESLGTENVEQVPVGPLYTTSSPQNRFSESSETADVDSSTESTQVSLPYQTAPTFRYPQPLGPELQSNQQFGETITESSDVYTQQTSPPPSASQVVDSSLNAPSEESQQQVNSPGDVFPSQPQPQPSFEYASGQLSSNERESSTVSQVQTSTTFEGSRADFQPNYTPLPSASTQTFTNENAGEIRPVINTKSADTTQISDDYYDDRFTVTTPSPLTAPRLETNPRNYETNPVPKIFGQDVPTTPRPWSGKYDEIAATDDGFVDDNKGRNFVDRRIAQQSGGEVRGPVFVNPNQDIQRVGQRQERTGLVQTESQQIKNVRTGYPQTFGLTASTARPTLTTTTIDEEVITTDSPKPPLAYSQINNEQLDGQRRYFPQPSRPFYNGPAYYPQQQQFGNYYPQPIGFNPQAPRVNNFARDQLSNFQPGYPGQFPPAPQRDTFPGQPSADVPYNSPARQDFSSQQNFFDGRDAQYRQGRDFNGQVIAPPYAQPGPYYPDWNNQQSYRREMYDRVRSDQIQYNQMMASGNQPPFLNNPNQQVENRYQSFNLPGNRTQVQVQNLNVDQASPEVIADYKEAVTELPPGERMVKFDEEVITLSPEEDARRRDEALRSDASASSQVVDGSRGNPFRPGQAFPYPKQPRQVDSFGSQRPPNFSNLRAASSNFRRQSNDNFVNPQNPPQSDSYALGPDRIAPARQPGGAIAPRGPTPHPPGYGTQVQAITLQGGRTLAPLRLIFPLFIVSILLEF